jgi:DNA-binding response OmpR family regulator
VTSPAVLLMLEEPYQLEVYGNLLRDKGYDTLLCISPHEGMSFLEAKDLSMAIVSQGTPAFEGRPVLERSVKLHPAVPVLVVARVVSMDCYLEAMNLGACDYFELPEPQRLARAVDIQLLRCALAGTVEWDRLSPILKSSGRDRDEKSPAGAWLPPPPSWEPPKLSGWESSPTRPEHSLQFATGSLRENFRTEKRAMTRHHSDRIGGQE